LISLQEAVAVIVNAPNRLEAGRIRNEVALHAMQGHRPESDADACREAFASRWSEDLLNQATYEEKIRGNWRGD
jgi:hypothetical protein